MTSGEDGGGIPSEMKEKLASFDSALTSLETELKPLLAKPRMEFFEKVAMRTRYLKALYLLAVNVIIMSMITEIQPSHTHEVIDLDTRQKSVVI